ncbi:MAG: NAD(+)/NADH kinase [Candidatus Dormibacteria bacterium]
MKAPDHGASIGFLLHFRESLESATLAEAREIAEAAQLRTWVAQAEAESVLARELRSARLLVAIGGDGTLLYAAKRAAPRGVPLLGVNRGQLGFLTTVEMAQLPEAIESFVKDRVQIEHRRTLRGEVRERVAGGVRAGVEVAVNEIVVKSEAVNLVRLEVTCDDQLVGVFDSDGMVVATSVGSTAYSLSAGGPPVDSRVPATVLTPLNPHALISRSLVIPDTLDVRIVVRRGRALAAADGEVWGQLETGAELIVKRGPDLSLARPPGNPGFFHRLRSKTGFGVVLKLAPEEGETAALAPDASHP